MINTRFHILFILLSFLGCHSTKESAISQEKAHNIIGSQVLTAEVSGCKIRATIISIDTTLFHQVSGSPCSKKPCIAIIRIDEIMKMGSMCGSVIFKGAELKVYFAFTLAETTKDLFPDLVAHYPGLQKNDTFVTSIQAKSGNDHNSYQATIFEYKKID